MWPYLALWITIISFSSKRTQVILGVYYVALRLVKENRLVVVVVLVVVVADVVAEGAVVVEPVKNWQMQFSWVSESDAKTKEKGSEKMHIFRTGQSVMKGRYNAFIYDLYFASLFYVYE